MEAFAEDLKNHSNVLTISSKRDMLVFEISDHRAFKIFLTNESFSDTIRKIGKHLGVKVAVFPPDMKLRIIQDRRHWTWKRIWYVLSGQQSTDRLIKKALAEYEDCCKGGYNDQG